METLALRGIQRSLLKTAYFDKTLVPLCHLPELSRSMPGRGQIHAKVSRSLVALRCESPWHPAERVLLNSIEHTHAHALR